MSAWSGFESDLDLCSLHCRKWIFSRSLKISRRTNTIISLILEQQGAEVHRDIFRLGFWSDGDLSNHRFLLGMKKGVCARKLPKKDFFLVPFGWSNQGLCVSLFFSDQYSHNTDPVSTPVILSPKLVPMKSRQSLLSGLILQMQMQMQMQMQLCVFNCTVQWRAPWLLTPVRLRSYVTVIEEGLWVIVGRLGKCEHLKGTQNVFSELWHVPQYSHK